LPHPTINNINRHIIPILTDKLLRAAHGDRGARDQEKRKGDRRRAGGRRRGGGKQDYKGGRKREKKEKTMQHCAIFCNRKNAKRWEPTNTGQELGLKGMGSVRCPPPHLRLYNKNLA